MITFNNTERRVGAISILTIVKDTIESKGQDRYSKEEVLRLLDTFENIMIDEAINKKVPIQLYKVVKV